MKDVNATVIVNLDGNEDEIAQKKAECVYMLEKMGLSASDVRNDIWLCDIATGKSKL